MKKVININFQGRVIPIEETAYDLLQQYIASLRIYFAKEEGRDEIINDIESRICELFGEQLKKGSSCITDEDINAIMNSMGRPADFEAADQESEEVFTAKAKGETGTGSQTDNSSSYSGTYSKRRLYRDEQDKVLGGVASGLAHYLKIDPAITRIAFALLAFAGGAGFLLYIVLWIALPSQSLLNNIRKRLYRDTDDRIFKGVCGGLAKYFDINPLVPRIIFAAPFLFGLITTLGRSFFFEAPVFIGGFSSSTFLVAYLILWAILPEAYTSSEKLEMRGEKVDLNSIRNTVMEDMQGFRGRAEKMGNDVKASATRVVRETQTAWKSQGSPFVNEAAGVVRRSSNGFGNALVVLLRAFIMIVGGIIAFSLLIGLVALLSTGIGRFELIDVLLSGFWQKILGWGVLLLFIGTPILSVTIGIIRRMMRAKTNNRYLGYTFSTLWLIGLFCLIGLIGLMSRDFRNEKPVATDFSLVQPSNGKLSVELAGSNVSTSPDDWFNWEGAMVIENDSLYLNTINVNVVRSLDSFYHVHLVKIGNGRNETAAMQRANKIEFPIVQDDSTLYLPEGFAVNIKDKWRNQRVVVVIEVPVGKRINLSSDLNEYNYFNVQFNRRRNRSINRRWDDDQRWNSNEDMIQTVKGLKAVSKRDEDRQDRYRYEDNSGGEDDNEDEINRPIPPPAPADSTPQNDSVYRYPTRIAQIKVKAPPVMEVKAVTAETGNIHFSPLASFLL